MDRYQLAKLVQWAEECTGSLESRKRMQKVVFLLKFARCPIDADYSLHYYGPYSADVAQLTDELVQIGLLDEASSSNQVGTQFSYNLNEQTDLGAFEASPAGTEALKKFAPFENIAKDLLTRDLNELEYAATIAYFQYKGNGWDDAFQKACGFKRLKPERDVAKTALALAKSVAR